MWSRFEKLLNDRKLTVYRVAKDTGLDPSMFSAWKRGKRNPKVDKLKILAEYFSVPIEYFI